MWMVQSCCPPTAREQCQLHQPGRRRTASQAREDPTHRFCPTFKREVRIPQLKHENDAGFDLCSMEEIVIEPLESRIVQTGLAIQIPKRYFGYICSRSSRAKDGLVVEGGVVDGSYRGEILIILYNQSKTQQKRIEIGDRVAQILILPVLNLPWVEVSKLSTTSCQDKGF